MRERLKVSTSYKGRFPLIPDLKVNFQKLPEGLVSCWQELAAVTGKVPVFYWHKGIFTSMLSDEYWSYAVAEVAAQLSENKLKSLLYPAPVTRWWFIKLVTWAAMDMVAINRSDTWPSDSQVPTPEDMELILAHRMNSSRFLSEKDREKVKNRLKSTNKIQKC